MAFRNKNSETILQSLINWTASKTDKLTDFNPGSAVRTLLESVSLQIEELYYDLSTSIRYAIANACYEAFGFRRKGARRASGQVTMFFKTPLASDVDIKEGTVFHTGDMKLRKVYFESTESVRALSGATSCLIPVECREVGSIGNVSAGEICKLQIGSGNIRTIANTEALINGADKESAHQREQRFREYIHTLARGGVDAVAFGIKQIPGVQGVYIDDSTVGFVVAYVHDENGDLTDSLKERVLTEASYWRSAGIEVDVRPIVKKEVDIDLEIYYKNDVDPDIFNEHIERLIIDYLRSFTVGEDLNMSSLVTVINDKFRDIVSYIDLEYEEDVKVVKNELIRPGRVKVIGKVDDR